LFSFTLKKRYIYTGDFDLTSQLDEDILKLLVASDELLLKELVEYLQEYLIEQRQNWVHQNFILVLHTIYNLESCKNLRDYCLESICYDSESFFTSEKFPSLDKDILYDLLERDYLQIEEILLWDCLIKWVLNKLLVWEVRIMIEQYGMMRIMKC